MNDGNIKPYNQYYHSEISRILASPWTGPTVRKRERECPENICILVFSSSSRLVRQFVQYQLISKFKHRDPPREPSV